MRPPRFWSQPKGRHHPAALALRPLSALYGAADRIRRSQIIAWRSPGPVICVGNASMGGVGKTPFAIMLAEMLADAGCKPGFLTRGYGGTAKGPVQVGDAHTAAEVGDEPLLLARHGAVMVARDREAGSKALFDRNLADVAIMDDGFQNPSLVKDLSFLLVDAEAGFGNGLTFPAGPLRESPTRAKARADAIVIVTRGPDAQIPADLEAFSAGLPLFRAWLKPVDPDPKKVVAFCGIGRPEKFYATARFAGYELAETHDFPDHHSWSSSDIGRLSARARATGLPLLTTEKDLVRLPRAFRAQVEALPVRMVVDAPAALGEVLAPLTQSPQADDPSATGSDAPDPESKSTDT